MHLDFEETMSVISDTELIKILTTDRTDYQDAALIAAEKEFARRNISALQYITERRTHQEQKEIRNKKANAPLDLPWKILSFVFPGIFQLIIAGFLKAGGYDRKANELGKWAFLGLSFYILLIIFTSVS